MSEDYGMCKASLTAGKAGIALHILVRTKFEQHSPVMSILGSRNAQLAYAWMLISSYQLQRADMTYFTYRLSPAMRQTKCLSGMLPTTVLEVLLRKPKFSLGGIDRVFQPCCDAVPFTGFASLARRPTSEHTHNASLIVQNCIGCSAQVVR